MHPLSLVAPGLVRRRHGGANRDAVPDPGAGLAIPDDGNPDGAAQHASAEPGAGDAVPDGDEVPDTGTAAVSVWAGQRRHPTLCGAVLY